MTDASEGKRVSRGDRPELRRGRRGIHHRTTPPRRGRPGRDDGAGHGVVRVSVGVHQWRVALLELGRRPWRRLNSDGTQGVGGSPANAAECRHRRVRDRVDRRGDGRRRAPEIRGRCDVLQPYHGRVVVLFAVGLAVSTATERPRCLPGASSNQERGAGLAAAHPSGAESGPRSSSSSAGGRCSVSGPVSSPWPSSRRCAGRPCCSTPRGGRRAGPVLRVGRDFQQNRTFSSVPGRHPRIASPMRASVDAARYSAMAEWSLQPPPAMTVRTSP